MRVGILNVRVFAFSNNTARCATEADHIHNLPQLLESYSPELLNLYLDVEQPIFLKVTGGVGTDQFEAHWEALRVFRRRTRIYVDFNSRDEHDNIVINLLDKPDVVEKIRNELPEGMKVVLYDEELEIEAQLRWSHEFRMWVGIPDWSSKRNLV